MSRNQSENCHAIHFKNSLYNNHHLLPVEILTETMIWFLACKWLFFAILLAANPAAAEEFQIQEPLGTMSAEHSPVATDTGHTTWSHPVSKSLRIESIHMIASHMFPHCLHLDQHYHEGWTKWFGLEGSTTGYCPHNNRKFLNRRKPQRRTCLDCICNWRRTDAEDRLLYWCLAGTPWHQSGLSQCK